MVLAASLSNIIHQEPPPRYWNHDHTNKLSDLKQNKEEDKSVVDKKTAFYRKDLLNDDLSVRVLGTHGPPKKQEE